MEIRAALPSRGGGLFEIVPLELREPEHDEIRVRIVASGVCHTDRMMLGRDMTILGHEGSGIVEALGPGVAGFQLGDHVVLSYPSCGVCKACRNSRPFDCDSFTELFMGERLHGTLPLSFNGQPVTPFFGQGSFATHAVVHRSTAVKVDKELDLKRLGPLGCGVQTGAGAVLNFLKPRKGSAIAIVGTGCVGLSAVLASRIAGCSPIIAVDKVESRLDLARRFGATHTINTCHAADIKNAIVAICGGIRYALDTTGSMKLMTAAASCLLSGGRGCGVAAAGRPRLSRAAVGLDIRWDEIIQGCAVPQTFIPRLLGLYKEGLFPFDEMVTFFDFENINEAFLKAAAAEAIKPVLLMPA